MYSRQLSYKSGVMVCRSTINAVSLGEKLSELTVNELQRATDGKNSSPLGTTGKLLKAKLFETLRILNSWALLFVLFYREITTIHSL